MPLLTIVEDYIFAAMRHAVVGTLDDGTLSAHVPEVPGLVALGADAHDCSRDLYGLLEEWVRIGLASGQTLRVLDGIDLNSDAGQILASYHSAPSDARESDIYEDETTLDEAFGHHGEVA